MLASAGNCVNLFLYPPDFKLILSKENSIIDADQVNPWLEVPSMPLGISHNTLNAAIAVLPKLG